MNQKQILKKTCNQFKGVAISFMAKDKYGINKKVFKRHGVTWDSIEKEFDDSDFKKYEIFTSIVFKDDNVLFIYDIDNHSDVKWDNILSAKYGIDVVLNCARQIENRYPNLLSWKFSGRGIQGQAIIRPHNGADKKFGSIFKFYKELKRHLDSISSIPGDTQFIHKNGINRCVGSINLKSKLHCVPITTDMSATDIYLRSKQCVIDTKLIKRPLINVDFWYKILTPMKTEHVNVTPTELKKINYDLFPPCIINILSEKDISNINRFKLIAFFKFIHSVKQVYQIFKDNLSDEKYELLTTGNDSKQIEHVYNNKNIKAPICAFYGKYCSKQCNRKNPLEGLVEVNRK